MKNNKKLLIKNNTTKMTDIEEYNIISNSNCFDKSYYIQKYNLRRNVDPINHYLKLGTNKGYNPSPTFDTTFYLKQNPDVKKSKINPLVHYIKYGKKEGRIPK